MFTIPELAQPLLDALAPAFTEPTFRRFTLLLCAALLTTGRRTVANLLRTVGDLATGDPSSFHRVLSHAHWSGLRLAALLTRFVLRRFWPRGTIELVGDDTVCEHPGRQVFGKGRHRDPVRSSHTYTAWRWGHKWVTLAVLVRLPGTTRPWALPLLVALYHTPQDNAQHGRRHKTPAQLLRQLVSVLLPWFPDRQFRLAADSGLGSHELAASVQQRRGRLQLVSRFHADANLYEPPPPYSGQGRPRVKGDKLPSPAQVVAATAQRVRLQVRWYGGGWRRVEVVSGKGQWYKGGEGLVAVRWV